MEIPLVTDREHCNLLAKRAWRISSLDGRISRRKEQRSYSSASWGLGLTNTRKVVNQDVFTAACENNWQDALELFRTRCQKWPKELLRAVIVVR